MDAWLITPVDDGPLDHEVNVRRMRQVVGTYVDDIAQLITQHYVKVVRIGGNRRTGNLLQRLALLVVYLPELMRHYFESDWVDLVALVIREDRQLGRDLAQFWSISFRIEVLTARNLQSLFCDD